MAGRGLLLDWLEDQDGDSWQQRWLASGAEEAGTSWWQLPARRAGSRDLPGMRRSGALTAALIAVIAGDVVRPSLAWLAAAGCDAELARAMAASRDPQGFARLGDLCDHGPGGPVAKTARHHALRRAAVILAAKGGMLADIAVGDFLELLDTEAGVLGAARAEAAACYRLLRQLGTFGPAAPARLRELRTAGQRTPGGDDRPASTWPAGPSVTCWSTTCGNASPGWITAAWNSWPGGWACSGRTWKPTIPASTACT